MHDKIIPALDRDALELAGAAFIDSADLPSAVRVRRAVFTYLYVTQNIRDDEEIQLLPSLHEIRSVIRKHLEES